MPTGWWNLIARGVLLALIFAALAATTINFSLTHNAGGPALTAGGDAPSTSTPICGRPILDSPWHYNGAPGNYKISGTTTGLPTFGAVGTAFPHATSLLVVPAGNNTSDARSGGYEVNNTVVYFEPGIHIIQGIMYTGHDSAYVGGYTPATGKAVIDGVNGATTTGKGGSYLSAATSSANSTVNDTWEYLDIKNYTSSQNSSVMGTVNGGGIDDGDTYKYDTIGPNDYGYSGNSTPPRTGESNGGGYAINLGSYTTIEYNCLTHNAQGAFNGTGTVNDVLAHNEISWNGLGEYPDTGGSGGSPFSCGCSGGGKLLNSVNADVVDNWIHDNYNVGVWGDFDNTGMLIAHNYIASNWGQGIEYEASYNGDIADNTLVGNGWASDGVWPRGAGGGSCVGGVSCAEGFGPVTGKGGGFPYGAIYLPNSSGNARLITISVPPRIAVPGCGSNCTVVSRYRGELLVTGNVLKNNFGGVIVYTDTNRFPGNIDGDSACSSPLGALAQTNNSTYYQQSRVLVTGANATISGSLVTSTGGTTTICADYGNNGGPDRPAGEPQAPSKGMAVYDQNSGVFLGNVASVVNAHSFTLTGSHGSEAGTSLLLSAYGGCGPADYFGGKPGMTSGTPPAAYWDNCIWGSRNVTISHNRFSMNANKVSACTRANLCGDMATVAFDAGVPALMRYWDSYPSYIARVSGGLSNVWSGNTYTWAGGGPGGWQFEAGAQGSSVTRSQWQVSPYGQDEGSSFR